MNDHEMPAVPEQVVLQGFHAVKHALRFGAEIEDIASLDLDALRSLARELAPDIEGPLMRLARSVSREEMVRAAGSAHPTGVYGVARKPEYGNAQERVGAPMVLLEEPRRPGNVGAVIRVAAAAGAAGVMTTGPLDPWHPAVLTGSAGLHFALPVRRLETLEGLTGPLVAFDPEGKEASGPMPTGSVFAFGTEREGLSKELLSAAVKVVKIPMRPGVSSLNLATSVAVALYAYGPGPSDMLE